jgi:hypothetical protein
MNTHPKNPPKSLADALRKLHSQLTRAIFQEIVRHILPRFDNFRRSWLFHSYPVAGRSTSHGSSHGTGHAVLAPVDGATVVKLVEALPQPLTST